MGNKPLNFLRMLAISLFIRFSSNSRTLAPLISAMNCRKKESIGNEHQELPKAYLRQSPHIGRHDGLLC